MRRWTFHITSALSLLLMLATVGLWGVSYIYSWHFDVNTHGPRWENFTKVDMSRGMFLWWGDYAEFEIADSTTPHTNKLIELDGPTVEIKPFDDEPYQLRIGRFAVWWDTPQGATKSSNWKAFEIILYIPHWFLALIFAILPTIWLIAWRRRRNLPDNICANCGYDLTGNTMGKCSECGEDIEPAGRGERTRTS